MKTKDLLLVAGGVAIGYLIFTKDLFKRVEKGTKEIVSGVKEGVTEMVNPKQAECEKKWTEFAQTIKPASKEALEKMKQDFMSSCLIS
jgi:hypothetical protein